MTFHFFFANIDSPAMVTTLYDVGCVLACSILKMCISLGLSDDEGTKQFWSMFVCLIGVQRSSSHQHHLWLIDCQATAIGSKMKADLGDWIKHHLKWGIKDQGSVALGIVNHYEIFVEDLQAQWADQ
ncbi:hypothetical protein BD769DRAFT_1388387 [Suillus cothurnatus]|nr:hypothetical protein BD769DRAFT_1388387 [Suillus cothurnatus]